MTQPCWTCTKYAGGCSWTAEDPVTHMTKFKPVEGWDAVETVHGGESNKCRFTSYQIRRCPEYEWDGGVVVDSDDGLSLKYDYEEFKRLFLAGMRDAEIRRRMGDIPHITMWRYKRMVREELST